jgi:hypothetical protein
VTLAAAGAEPERRGFCGKVPFESSQDAMVVARLQETRFGHPAAAAYACPTWACRSAGIWHLTSGHGTPRELLDWGGAKQQEANNP